MPGAAMSHQADILFALVALGFPSATIWLNVGHRNLPNRARIATKRGHESEISDAAGALRISPDITMMGVKSAWAVGGIGHALCYWDERTVCQSSGSQK